ncbi:MAG: dockerin type I repeat-containing protein, partial [Muribaculaceae bacterium]|nr:dockerin type I repeat-containing protein [Muribaculaceae bacterium]
RYRPCYTSAAGNTYYGEWKEFSITDAVGEYEPILYNYGVMKLTPKTVTLRALVLAGSSDIQTQGFTYKVSHWSADSYYVGGSGQIMECTITDLKPGTPYVAHVSVYAGHNYVSRDVYFTTPQLSYDVNGDGEINIADVNAAITGIIDSDAGYDGSIDVNGDGENNIADVNAIIGIIVSDQ